jgi:glycosyltransferase involved in cell wall biosynthesis
MRLGIVHNLYRHPGGEETVVENTRALLAGHGHEVVPFFRHSTEISGMRGGRTRAFFSGIYSFSARKAMGALLAERRFDAMNVHNLFPLISPSVLGACREAGVPIVMTLHNYRLSCPHGIHMRNGQVCERCTGGREYWCVLCNCEGSRPKSLGYAVRGFTARVFRFYADTVTMYVVFTQFHRARLLAEGIPADRVAVIPNMVAAQPAAADPVPGDYVAFVGRVSPEKGIATLLGTARRCPDIPFKIAGGYEQMPHLPGEAPENVDLRGHLTGPALQQFYRSARMLVMPSVWWETFGMSLVEAMVWWKPAVVSRLGALTEVVDEGITGLTAEPGNAEDWSEKIRYLWERPRLCRQMGLAARDKALREYSPQAHYERLMATYETAVKLGPPHGSGTSSQVRHAFSLRHG